MTDLSFQTPLYLALPLVVVALSLMLIGVVLADRWRRTIHWLLALLFMDIGLWGLFIFLMRYSSNVEQALFWDRLVAPVILLMPALYFHFTVVYAGTRIHRFLVTAAYLLPTVALALIPTNLLVVDMEVQEYGYSPDFAPLMYILSLAVYLLLLAGVYNLFRAYGRAESYADRNRLRYLMAAIVFPMLGGVFEFFPSSYPSAMFGNLLFCMVTAVAILKYHLLDIDVAFRKGLSYLLMSAMVAVPYVGLIMGFNQVLGSSRMSVWVHLLMLTMLALALLPLWGRVQEFINRLFYRQRYDYLRALEDFSNEAHDVRNLDVLAGSLVKLVNRALQTAGVYLFLPTVSGDFEVISSTDNKLSGLTLHSHSAVVSWLRGNRRSLHFRTVEILPQLQSLSALERSRLAAVKTEMLVPLKTKDEELVGILVLAHKVSDQPFSEEDERLVTTVASRMAVEIENARLYFMESSMRRELEEQNQRKTEFLHSVAHELKTPLTAIISSSELLRTDLPSLSENQTSSLLTNINKSSWRMNKRISELLDFAKIQTGLLELSRQYIDPAPFLQDLIGQFTILFASKGQNLVFDVPETLPYVYVDRTKLEQIFINLIENANKFSPRDTEVRLSSRVRDNEILFEVHDSAVQVSEEERLKIFEPYYRGEDGDQRQRLPGLGLGLAIAKELAKLHDGRIWVMPGADKGNVFVLCLPIAVDYQPEKVPAERSSSC